MAIKVVSNITKIKVLYVKLAGPQLLLSLKSMFRMQILSCIQRNCKKLTQSELQNAEL